MTLDSNNNLIAKYDYNQGAWLIIMASGDGGSVSLEYKKLEFGK